MQTWSDYRRVKKLGEGGFGEVWEVQCRRTGTRLALKSLRPEHAENTWGKGPSTVERFLAEAELLMSLSHPHLVRVYRILTDTSPVAFVMERLEGTTLSAHPSPSGTWLAQVFEKVASALAYLHRHGILHRDVKADNVFVRNGKSDVPAVKLLDLGVAKHLECGSQTYQGTLVGTTQTLSPECFERLADDRVALTPAVDQWSFGVMMYRLLTGRRPFVARALGGLIRKIQHEPTPKVMLQEYLASDPIARALVPIVERCLAKRPEDRYASMEVVQVELSEAQDELAYWEHDTLPQLDAIPTEPTPPADMISVRPMRSVTRWIRPFNSFIHAPA